MTSTLFSSINAGSLSLKHRVAMAPLTRMRSTQPGNVPSELAAEYYSQRATDGGLIVAEATQISASGQGYPATPGIYSKDQIEGWRKVTSAVHAKGGRIVLQLWHVGRISHSSFQPGGAPPVAPSAVAAAGESFTASWQRHPYETPRPLTVEDIIGIIENYRLAARNAIAAGFDGVELHGANGYLIEQFLQSRSNRRTDRFGGSIENRTRLLLEATDAIVSEVGASRVGVRLSPFGVANDSGEDAPLPLYTYAIEALGQFGLAYLHLIEPRASGSAMIEAARKDVPLASKLFRDHWRGVLIAAGGYDRSSAAAAVSEGHADIVAFGRSFISNPDLVERFRTGASFSPWNRETFYGGSGAGYTDYPPHAASR